MRRIYIMTFRPSAAVYNSFLFIQAILLLFVSTPVTAQKSEKTFKQDDVFSIFVKKEKRAKRDSLTFKPVEIRKPYFATTPFVGYNPAYGFLIGVGTTMAIYLGDPETTPVSSVCAAINLTTAKQTSSR